MNQHNDPNSPSDPHAQQGGQTNPYAQPATPQTPDPNDPYAQQPYYGQYQQGVYNPYGYGYGYNYEPSHSKAGIASIIVGVLTIIAFCIVNVAAVAVMKDQQFPQDPADFTPAQIGFAVAGCLILLLPVLGLILGFVGLAAGNAKKATAIGGTVLNGVILLGIIVLAILSAFIPT